MLATPFAHSGGDPFAEMRRMQNEINRLFADFADFGDGQAARGFPAVNLRATDDGVLVTATVPGIEDKDLDVSVQDDVLTIRGKRSPAAEGDDIVWHRRERGHGEFARAVSLPFRVDADKVQARLTNGILEIALQRPEEDKPKRIKIAAK